MPSITQYLYIIVLFGEAMTAPAAPIPNIRAIDSRGEAISEYIVREGAIVDVNRQLKRTGEAISELIFHEGEVVDINRQIKRGDAISELIIKEGEIVAVE